VFRRLILAALVVIAALTLVYSGVQAFLLYYLLIVLDRLISHLH